MEDVVEIERACHRLIARLALCIDKHDAEGLRDLFVDDGVFDRGDAAANGIEEIVAFIGGIPAHFSMLHHYTNILIDVAQDHASATGHANYVAYNRSAKAEDPKAALTPISIGSVRDEFTRTADGWRFSRRTIERLAG